MSVGNTVVAGDTGPAGRAGVALLRLMPRLLGMDRLGVFRAAATGSSP